MKCPPIVLHILFTIYAWLIALLFLPLYFVFFMIVLLLLGYKRAYLPIRSFYFIYYLLWSPIKIIYHPDFDPNKPYVLMQNHVNVLDAFLVGRHSPNPTCGLMHGWQFNIPFYGWIMRLSKGIPVNPKRKDNFKRIVEHARDRYQQGLSIITFPEGGRTLDEGGKMKPFKRGMFAMAQEVGYQVVPIAVRGNRQINQKGSMRFWPNKVEIQVGKPRTIPNSTKQATQTIIDEIHTEMNTFIQAT